MKKLIPVCVCLLLLSSCADREIVTECLHGHTYGFFGGLWHGIITPFSFIGSLFSDNVSVYATNNNGGWYTFGFLLGSGGWGLMAGSSSKSKS